MNAKSPDTLKHTPGPWHDEDGRIYTGKFQVASTEWARKEHRANARLIASAPSLLEACRKALADLEDVYEQAELSEPLRLNVVGSIGRLIGVIAAAEGSEVPRG